LLSAAGAVPTIFHSACYSGWLKVRKGICESHSQRIILTSMKGVFSIFHEF